MPLAHMHRSGRDAGFRRRRRHAAMLLIRLGRTERPFQWYHAAYLYPDNPVPHRKRRRIVRKLAVRATIRQPDGSEIHMIGTQRFHAAPSPPGDGGVYVDHAVRELFRSSLNPAGPVRPPPGKGKAIPPRHNEISPKK